MTTEFVLPLLGINPTLASYAEPENGLVVRFPVRPSGRSSTRGIRRWAEGPEGTDNSIFHPKFHFVPPVAIAEAVLLPGLSDQHVVILPMNRALASEEALMRGRLHNSYNFAVDKLEAVHTTLLSQYFDHAMQRFLLDEQWGRGNFVEDSDASFSQLCQDAFHSMFHREYETSEQSIRLAIEEAELNERIRWCADGETLERLSIEESQESRWLFLLRDRAIGFPLASAQHAWYVSRQSHLQWREAAVRTLLETHVKEVECRSTIVEFEASEWDVILQCGHCSVSEWLLDDCRNFFAALLTVYDIGQRWGSATSALNKSAAVIQRWVRGCHAKQVARKHVADRWASKVSETAALFAGLD